MARNTSKARLLFGRQVARDSLVQSGKPVARRLLKKERKEEPRRAAARPVARLVAQPVTEASEKTALAQVWEDTKAFFAPESTRLAGDAGAAATSGIFVAVLVLLVVGVWLWGLSRSGQEAFNREGQYGFASTHIWFALTFLFGVFCPPIGVTLGIISLVKLGASPKALA